MHLIYFQINVHYTYTLTSLESGHSENGILLETSSIFMHMYYRSTIDYEYYCKHNSTTTPSARKTWKRRTKKHGQASEKPRTSDEGINGSRISLDLLVSFIHSFR